MKQYQYLAREIHEPVDTELNKLGAEGYLVCHMERKPTLGQQGRIRYMVVLVKESTP